MLYMQEFGTGLQALGSKSVSNTQIGPPKSTGYAERLGRSRV